MQPLKEELPVARPAPFREQRRAVTKNPPNKIKTRRRFSPIDASTQLVACKWSILLSSNCMKKHSTHNGQKSREDGKVLCKGGVQHYLEKYINYTNFFYLKPF